MKKIIALALAAMMLFSLAACGSGDDSGDAKTYTVGICQLVQHPALDAATQGFKDVLTEEFGDAVTFEEGNAAGDSAITHSWPSLRKPVLYHLSGLSLYSTSCTVTVSVLLL